MKTDILSKLVYLIYPIMATVIIWGAEISKKGEWNDEFLSLKQSKYFQGYITICIMLHHIGQDMCPNWQVNYKKYPGLELFVPIGFILVGFFMFFSGYGLYVSYKNKPNYLNNHYFKNRVLPLVIGLYASNWIFLIVRLIMGEKMNKWKMFCYISGIGMPNLYAWFAVIMPLMYIFFYIAFKYCGKYKIAAVALMVFIYTFVGTCIDHNDYLIRGEWWYNCVHMFWIGIIVGKYKDKLVESAKKGYILRLILCAIGLIVFWELTEITKGVFSYYGQYNPFLSRVQVVAYRWICLLAEMIEVVLAVYATLLLGMKIKIGNRFLQFMGTITLEFYLIHGLVVELFSNRFCDEVKPIVRITNGALMIAIVFICSVPLAILFKKICYIGSKSTKIK